MRKTERHRIRETAIVALIFLLAAVVPSLAVGAEPGGGETVRVALLPWKVNSAENVDFVKDALADMLASRIGSSEGVELVGPAALKAAATKGELDDKKAAKLGAKLKADFVLYGSLTVMGAAVSMDARLVKVPEGSATPLYSRGASMDSIIVMADKLSKDVVAAVVPPTVPQSSDPAISTKGLTPVAVSPPIAAPLVTAPPAPTAPPVGDGFIIRPGPGEKKPVVWKSKAIKGGGLYVSMVAADLNKDGAKELFIIRNNRLVVAEVKPGGLKIIKEIKADPSAQNVAVTTFDSDGDGRAEVWLSSVFDSRPSSSVVEFIEGDYKVTVTGVKFLVRTVRADKSAPVLIGQKYREKDGFYGGLVKLKKEGDRVVVAGPFEVKLPRRVDIYRFEAFDLTGDGGMELVTIDKWSRLRVYNAKKKGRFDKWERGWKSRAYYGGTLNRIEVEIDDVSYTPLTQPESVPVEGRFFHIDLNNDGKEELIIKTNTPGGLGRKAAKPGSFVVGEILSLSGDASYAEYISENWKTRELGGYIADFLIDDLDGDGVRELTVLLVEGTNAISGIPKSYILSYRLNI